MNKDNADIGFLLGTVQDLYENKLPFNKLLGLKVVHLTPMEACLKFPMKHDLVGNFVHGILHGGVISAVLDTTGGITATASFLEKATTTSIGEITKRISKVSTVDMRVDYLRPGKGDYFFSKGIVMRTGRKIAVIRMELKNQDDMLIAVGTGAYMVG